MSKEPNDVGKTIDVLGHRTPPVEADRRRDLALDTERGPPPHFAGRQRELATMLRRFDWVREQGNAKSGIALVTGVPGVGKTQFAARLAAEVAARADGNAGVLIAEPQLLSFDVSLFMAIGGALDADEEFREVAELDTKIIGGSVGAATVRGSVTREHGRHTGEFPALLRASRRTSAWDGKAFVLIVDELQSIQPSGMNALHSMHLGLHECPLLVVGVGLQHTPQVLSHPKGDAPGISRIDEPVKLDCLGHEESVEALVLGMEALGRQIPEAQARRLADESQGFPQHIHGYLTAACAAYDAYGSMESASAMAQALALGRKARTAFYNRRLNALLDRDSMQPIINAMAETNTNAMTRRQAATAIDSAQGGDGTAAVDSAIAHGVLSVEDDGLLRFAVPSLHAYMLQHERHRGLPISTADRSLR